MRKKFLFVHNGDPTALGGSTSLRWKASSFGPRIKQSSLPSGNSTATKESLVKSQYKHASDSDQIRITGSLENGIGSCWTQT